MYGIPSPLQNCFKPVTTKIMYLLCFRLPSRPFHISITQFPLQKNISGMCMDTYCMPQCRHIQYMYSTYVYT